MNGGLLACFDGAHPHVSEFGSSAERTPFPLFLFLLPSCQRVTTTLVYAELEQNAIGGPQVKAILSNVLAVCR